MVGIRRIALDGEAMADTLKQLHVVALLVVLEDLKRLGARLGSKVGVVCAAGEEDGFCVFVTTYFCFWVTN